MAKEKAVIVGPGNIGSEVLRQLTDASEFEGIEISDVFGSFGRTSLDEQGIGEYLGWYEQQKELEGKDTLSEWIKTGDADNNVLESTRSKPENVNLEEWVEWKKILEDDDVRYIFIATSSDGSGLPYTLDALKHGKTVITCEKYAPANNFHEIDKYIESGDCWLTATVGGGTGIPLALMEDIISNGVYDAFYGVVNGTTNYILTECGDGKEIDKAINEAKSRGYTEPGADGAQSIIEGEVNDIRKKAAIIYNLTMLCTGNKNNYINENDIKFQKNCAKRAYDDLAELYGSVSRLNENPNIKLVVSIKNKKTPDTGEEIEELGRYEGDNYLLQIGFLKNPCDELNEITGVNNGAVILRNGTYSELVTPGPGAGSGPTAKRMLDDLKDYRNGTMRTQYNTVLR